MRSMKVALRHQHNIWLGSKGRRERRSKKDEKEKRREEDD